MACVLAARILEREPAHPPALLVLGDASAALGRYAAARGAYDRLLEVVGETSGSLCRARGELEKAAGQWQAAEGWFRRSINAAPDDARGYIYLGALQAVRGELEAALETHAAGTRAPQGPVDEAWLNHGLVLRALGRLDEARRSLDEAIRLDPEYAEARRVRADVIQASALADEA